MNRIFIAMVILGLSVLLILGCSGGEIQPSGAYQIPHSNQSAAVSSNTEEINYSSTTLNNTTPSFPQQETFSYSWDDSWNPTQRDFPLSGLIDKEYNDHRLYNNEPTPILPPGKWDWNDKNNDFANYRNFKSAIGSFSPLVDPWGNQYGWKLIGNDPQKIDYTGPAMYFEGSSGVDVLKLGPHGQVHSFTNGNLSGGPDILVFDKSWTLDFRTGATGDVNDDDLVIAGCNNNGDSSFDITTTTIHTGPDSDLIFARDMARSAVDAGNGDGGKTNVLDSNDGNDIAEFHGNMADFRFFGGNGDDTAIWYVDEVNQAQLWLYPNFFGGGGSGDAIWGDNGIDRLILVTPSDTQIVDKPTTQGGQLMVRIDPDYPSDIEWDQPVFNDLYARYCIHCGESTSGDKTLTLEYRSENGKVFTGYFYITGFEILQLGLGSEARVFRLDAVAGKAIEDNTIGSVSAPIMPTQYCS